MNVRSLENFIYLVNNRVWETSVYKLVAWKKYSESIYVCPLVGIVNFEKTRLVSDRKITREEIKSICKIARSIGI